jgi:hypothetical protein
MWLYQGAEFDESLIDGNVAFVYIIENTMNKKRYIGKKLFQFTKSKKVKGRKKRVKTDSNWKEYYGSAVRRCQDFRLSTLH